MTFHSSLFKLSFSHIRVRNVITAHIQTVICIFDVHGSVHRRRIFTYNQQDATLHNLFISVKCSTCFRRFLRPSLGAQNCIYSIGYFVKPLLLPATVVPSLPRQWQVAVKFRQSIPCCMYSFELLMMGGGTP